MSELERELRSLAADVAWPPTPAVRVQLDEPPARRGGGRSCLRGRGRRSRSRLR